MSEKIVQLNEEVIKGQIKEFVRGSVEETLNGLLEAEAEKLTRAAKYERNEERQGYRSGHYSRNLTPTSGDVTLNVPRLKGISFETAIIERYRRRESSVEEALIEMYLAGVSVRRVEDITEALWGSKVSPSTISELNKKAYVHIEDWRNRPLHDGRYPYVYVDGIYLRRNWGGECENVAVLVAIAVNEDGYREVLGAAEGMKEDKSSWVGAAWMASNSLLEISARVCWRPWAKCSRKPSTSAARCTFTATCFLWCPNPRSSWWQRCSRRFMRRRARRSPVKKQRLWLPSFGR
jgi:putative transposase